MNLILAPILIPFLAAVLCLFLKSSLKAQRIVSGITFNLLPLLSGYILYKVIKSDADILILRAGAWPDGYGIVFTVDLLGGIMLCLAAITQWSSFWFILAGALEIYREKFLLYPLFLLLGGGVNWAFMTGDLFNLFVSFEVILLSSYALLVHGNERGQVREGIKFVVLNMIASTLFLISAGYAYGAFGSLNFAELSLRIALADFPGEAAVLGTMLLVTFGMKAALFPMFFWLPDAYPKAPAGVVAYFSGILTKVGVYCLYRVFTLLFYDESLMTPWFQPLILAIGGLTMIVGVLCALAQMTMRRILSFHIISQIGYMIFGLGLFTVSSLAFGIFYIIHHIIVKASLFLVADAVKLNEGSEELEKTGGVAQSIPVLSVLFLFAAFSLAGIPPLSGFYGKYGLAVEGISQGWYFYVFVSLLTSLFTVASMAKIWRYIFWRNRQEGQGTNQKTRNMGVVAATGSLVAVSIVVALLSSPLMKLAQKTSNQLMNPDGYVSAVLGQDTLDKATSQFVKVAEEDME